MRSHRSRQPGFTLIEVLVVLSIMVVLAAVGSSSFAWFNQTTRVRSAAFDLVADLDFARSEAIKRNADVVVAGVGGSWNNGWTVAVGGTTLRQRGALGAQVAFVTNPGTVTYDGGGRAALGTANPFQVCPPDRGNLSGRTIRLDASGLSRSLKTFCAPIGT